jgi:serine protease Do
MASQPLARRFAAVAIFCGALAACSPQASTAASTRDAAVPAVAAAASATTPAAAPMVQGLPDFTALVSQFGPAVVNVDVVSRQRETRGWQGPPGMSPNDPFSDFFRRFGIPAPGGGNAPPARGEGSGFIVTPDGYILTNAHVVDGATDVTVRLTDRREFSAKVIGSDKRTDVAVIKIDAKGLPTVKIGDPSKLRPGEWVVAIGSPFGFDNSVTAGIVSGISRSLPDDNYVPFIQTDVAVNPGNSGGPLFNLAGEVVGINSQIYSRTGGFMGLSFAIPIDIARSVEGQLIKTGRVSRGRIGVTVQEVNAQFAESFGLDRPRGALDARVAQTLVHCAVQLAQQVVRSELVVRPELVVRVAADALDAVMLSARHIRVYAHPDDLPLIAEGADDALRARGARLLADETLERGGVRVDSDAGTLDARIATRWAQAAAALGSELGWSAESGS